MTKTPKLIHIKFQFLHSVSTFFSVPQPHLLTFQHCNLPSFHPHDDGDFSDNSGRSTNVNFEDNGNILESSLQTAAVKWVMKACRPAVWGMWLTASCWIMARVTVTRSLDCDRIDQKVEEEIKRLAKKRKKKKGAWCQVAQLQAGAASWSGPN